MEKRYFTSDLSQPLVGFVDLLDRNDLDVGGDVVLAAEVEHLLGFGEAADERAREAAAREDEAEDGDGQRLLWRAHHGDVAVAAQQVDVGVDVVFGGHGVEDEVEAAGVLGHLVGVARDDNLIGAEAQSVVLLAGEVVKTTVWAPRACANFTPMWPSPPRPTTPTFLPLVTPQWRMGE